MNDDLVNKSGDLVNDLVNDTISRAAALSALNGCTEIFLNNLPPTIYKGDAIIAIKALPPVSFENHDEIKSYSKDAISRQAAIKAADSIIERDTSGNNDVVKAMTAWKKFIEGLPPTQPVEDIHREKEQAYYCGYEDGAKAARSAQPGWTYTEKALPETIINEHTHDYQEYNCLCDFGDNGFDVRTYKFGNGHFWNGGGAVDKYVTAWQPLPEIPDTLKQKPWEEG